MKCRCEYAHCDHLSTCEREAKPENLVRWIGALCDKCFAHYPDEYKVAGHALGLVEDESDNDAVLFTSGYGVWPDSHERYEGVDDQA